jgi:hypothetical protein
MDAKLTRRQLAVALASAVPGIAQTAAQTAAPAPAPDDYDAISRAQIKQNTEQMAKSVLPMSVEPSFVFKP